MNLETFSSNPQYYITLVDPDVDDNMNMCTVIIALMLKETRLRQKQRGRQLSFGFYIYNVSIGIKTNIFKRCIHILIVLQMYHIICNDAHFILSFSLTHQC